MSIIVSNLFPGEAFIPAVDHTIRWDNHLSLFKSLLDLSDSIFLVSPFLSSNVDSLFSGMSFSDKKVELITTCAPIGDDHFRKPYQLDSYCKYFTRVTGKWPEVGIDQSLHSKVYVFSKDKVPFAGIVTSANLTNNGMVSNNETGVLVLCTEALEQLISVSREGLDFVSLKSNVIERLIMQVQHCNLDVLGFPDDVLSSIKAKNPHFDLKSIFDEIQSVDLKLINGLERVAVPSGANRNISFAESARYFIKVSGDRERPILPEDREPINTTESMLVFGKKPKRLRINDCIIEVAVGGACFLSYYRCTSPVYQFSERERRVDRDKDRWPFYVYGRNLSLNYGPTWFEDPFYYDPIVEEFKHLYPDCAVTENGGHSIKNAVQMSNSYFEVTREFGEFITQKINAYKP